MFLRVWDYNYCAFIGTKSCGYYSSDQCYSIFFGGEWFRNFSINGLVTRDKTVPIHYLGWELWNSCTEPLNQDKTIIFSPNKCDSVDPTYYYSNNLNDIDCV